MRRPLVISVVITVTMAVIAVLLSLWLRAAYLPLGVWAPHDDLLFIRLAGRIDLWLRNAFAVLSVWSGYDDLLSTQWLGPYDTLILAKGISYPIFILINKATGLPLKISEHVIYLAASLFAATTLVRLTGRRWLLLPVFIVLALSPTPWMMQGGARVVREALYQSLSLALFFLAAHYFLSPGRRVAVGLVLGLVAGCYWLTREEGLWLVPALTVLALPWLNEMIRRLPKVKWSSRHAAWLRDSLPFLFTPLASFMLVVLSINTANFAAYGVFRNNDLRSGPFPAAYGALARIKHDEWKPYVVFPRDARQRAYAVSPAARELAPFLEGELGKSWITASRQYPKPWGCPNEPTICNDEILSGWLVWALRDAVSAAGYYRSARAADAFYSRLADEINAACDTNAIPCHAPRASLVPVWRTHFLTDTLNAGGDVLKTLTTLDHGHVGVPPSPVTLEQARVIQFAINSHVSGFDAIGTGTSRAPGRPDEMRMRLTRNIGMLYAKASPPLFMLALLSYVFLLVTWIRVKSSRVSTYSIVILTALLVAVFSRVGLLGFLEATSFPSNDMGYVLPVVPFYLLFVAASLGLGGAAICNIEYGKAHLSW